jgi:CelD/BcsL family acetyltransferase involved in cellulose biosynthesis
LSLTLAVLTDLGTVDQLVPEWRELARTAARSPFESPDWLMAWYRHYGGGSKARVLTWRASGDERLVGVAPLVLSGGAGPRLRHLGLWGAAGHSLRGMVDVLAVDAHRPEVLDSLAGWLRTPDSGWDLLHVLRLPAGSVTPGWLDGLARTSGWRVTRLTGVVSSVAFALQLPATLDGWAAHLGRKTRYNMRREANQFAELGGVYELQTDPSIAPEVVETLERLMLARWGDADIGFGRDPEFRSFLVDAFRSMLAAGTMVVHVARDGAGVRACVVTVMLNGEATPALIGVSQDPDIRAYSLGKHLFDESIRAAIEHGCRTYDFLMAGDYKERFWHAEPRTLESRVVGRGGRGRLAALYVDVRRRRLPALRRRLARR